MAASSFKARFTGMRLGLVLTLIGALLASFAAQHSLALAEVSITSVQAYTQDFNSLANTGSVTWTDDTTLKGWYASVDEITFNTQQYVASDGSTGTPKIYSFGTGTEADRALGGVVDSTNTPVRWGVRLKNDTGGQITAFTIQYVGEQWFDGNNLTVPPNPSEQKLDFEYKVGSPTVTSIIGTTGWVDNSITGQLEFNPPHDTAANTTLNGNDPANRTLVGPVTITLPTPLTPGQEIMFRWNHENVSGTDHRIGIDDLVITPTVTGAPVKATCPATTVQSVAGTPATANVSAQDADGTVTSASITNVSPNPGVGNFTLTNVTPAPSPGGTLNATINVGSLVPAGNYAVTVTFSNNDPTPQTTTCTVNFQVNPAPTNLTINKEGPASGTYRPGDPLVYTIQVANGIAVANTVVVTDVLPAELSYVSDDKGAIRSGQTLTWNFGTLNQSEIRTIVLTTTVAPGTTANITNTASVSTTSPDPDLNNSSSVVVSRSFLPANFSTSTKTVNTTTVAEGSVFTYTLTISNSGETSSNYAVSDTLDSKLTLVSTTPPMNTTGNTLTANGTLAPGSQQQYTIVVRANAGASGTVTNSATIIGDGQTRTVTAPTVTILLNPTPANFAGSNKTVDKTTVLSGGELQYTITVSNSGQLQANYSLTDVIDPNLTIVSAPGMTANGQTLTASGTLAGGTQQQFTIAVTVKPTFSGTINNSATLTGDGQTRTLSAPAVTVQSAATPANFSQSTKTVDKEQAEPGDQLIYTIRIVNSGEQSGNFSVRDVLDSNLTLVEAPNMTVAGRALTASGTIAGGAEREFTIVVTVNDDAEGTINNTATLTGDGQSRTLTAPAVAVIPAPSADGTIAYLPMITK